MQGSVSMCSSVYRHIKYILLIFIGLLITSAPLNIPAQPKCLKWEVVCEGQRCVQSIRRATDCYICTHYVPFKHQKKALGQAVTCQKAVLQILQQQGWSCTPQLNPYGNEIPNRLCTQWSPSFCHTKCTLWGN